MFIEAFDLKRWERQFHAGSNLVIGVVFACVMFFITMPAHALLMGEKAVGAPLNKLKTALRLYKKGETHSQVWRKTGWYCPQRKRLGCRWEIPANCADASLISFQVLRHTDGKKISLRRMFNSTCLWRRYPQLKKQIIVYLGKCGGYWGTASHNGEICINRKKVFNELFNKQGRLLPRGERLTKAKKDLHWTFIHEIQHHIQFAEGWPKSSGECPYRQRMLEREAYAVNRRISMTHTQRRETPPHWYAPGLC